MSKFKVGDKVVRHTNLTNYLMQGKPYCIVTEVDGEYIAIDGNTDGCGWDQAYFDPYQEPAQKTFNPKPGDTIVTSDAGDWICVSKDDKRFAAYPEYDFFGVQGSYFQGWVADGSVRRAGDDYDSYLYQRYAVKEIIPAPSENLVAIPQENPDLSFNVRLLELENQFLRKLLREKGVEV